MRQTIFWVAMGAFAIGTSEFSAMGLLPYFANEFGVSEAPAGYAISAYALGVVLGAPILAIMGSRWQRKPYLIVLMFLFGVGNLLSAMAPDFKMFTFARFIAGLPHGAFFGIGMLYIAELLGPGRKAEGVSKVILGLTIANIVGVPLASWIAQSIGWRSGFYLVFFIASLASLMIGLKAPQGKAPSTGSPLQELKAFKNKHVWLCLLMGMIGFGGMFSVYSYASATLIEHTKAPAWVIPLMLSAFGVGNTAGTFLSGAISEGRILKSALFFQIFLGLSTLLYTFTIDSWPFMVFAILLLGMGGGLVVPIQTRLMEVAGEAQVLAAASNHASFNVANALGPWLAGLCLANGYGWASTGYVGVALSIGGCLIWILMALADSKRTADQ